MNQPIPSTGRIVHYVSYGTPGGEYGKECRAAIITGTYGDDTPGGEVALCVLNPTGVFFNMHVMHDESEPGTGGTWHWPERTP